MPPLVIMSIQPSAIRGGPSIQHIAFLEQLRSQGVSCHVVIPRGSEMLSEYESIAISVTQLDKMPLVPRSFSPIVQICYFLSLVVCVLSISRVLSEREVDVVHTFGEGFLAGAISARLKKVPSALHIIGMQVFYPRLVRSIYCKLISILADKLICCQAEIQEILLSQGISKNKLSLIYNSIDVDSIRNKASLFEMPRNPEERCRVGMVAGFDRRKGQLVLAKAAAIISELRSDVRFYLVGSIGSDRSYVNEIEVATCKLIPKDIFTITGSVNETAPWLDSFDIVCVPSLSEALPVAGLEAMALARPIVASRVGGNVELVKDGQTGYLCLPNNAEDLAAKILELVNDKDRRESFGQASLLHVQSKFCVIENGKQLKLLLAAMSNSSK